MGRKPKGELAMTNAERSLRRRNKLAQDPEKHAKAKARDTERKQGAKDINESSGKANELRRLEKALREALQEGERKEKAALQRARKYKKLYLDEKKERKRLDGLVDVHMEDKRRSDALLDGFIRREGACTRYDCASMRVENKQLRKDKDILTKWSAADRRLVM